MYVNVIGDRVPEIVPDSGNDFDAPAEIVPESGNDFLAPEDPTESTAWVTWLASVTGSVAVLLVIAIS